ncbi:hypothetical protein THAOC_32283 [Thalassiosira oceanica]|uniref:Uncharacterized protein n=1 Tax=Thalassiosira oceanica TaxID=159749 RepID=K0R9H7_THAOC|nr:hypothetical protein THAOC_32283 [Thalassiosira oceanica]|eukprot:EJK48889.1 hypothetical protein THAOC_32283 [Thalassiosira oceanica]
MEEFHPRRREADGPNPAVGALAFGSFVHHQAAEIRCHKHASGVWGDDRVYPDRPSALYTPTGPLGRSVASVDLKQPSMHRRSSVCRLRCARDPVTSSFS